MNNTENILNMAKQNNGIVTSKMITDSGYHRELARYLVNEGKLAHPSRGIYILPEYFEDEMYNFQNKYKRGIYCNETVLFLCDLTDSTPLRYTMMFPTNYNTTSPKNAGIKCFQSKPDIYSNGIVEYATPSGNKVKCYCVEKTLCDILIPRYDVDIQIVTEAFKRYANSKNRNIPLLSEYGKLLKVEDKLRAYLEVLI